jgi:hypothetical protein
MDTRCFVDHVTVCCCARKCMPEGLCHSETGSVTICNMWYRACVQVSQSPDSVAAAEAAATLKEDLAAANVHNRQVPAFGHVPCWW